MSVAPIEQQFQDEIEKVVDKFRDQGITVSQAVGVLEVVKMNIWEETQYRPSEIDDLI